MAAICNNDKNVNHNYPSPVGGNPNEFLSLLKIDGKGWNNELFKDPNKIEAICAHCSQICCNAVELGCNHNDNDIYPYCEICLNQLILNNQNNCPINSHPKPIINPLRSLRRAILKYKVLCPNSIVFKLKSNTKNDNNIIQTNQLQNEGVIADNNITECQWIGSLYELITNHHIKCIKIYNKEYIIIKQLKKQNKQQLLTINKLKKDILTHKNQNNLLNVINEQQKRKIRQQLAMINELKSKLNKNNDAVLAKEENKNDDNSSQNNCNVGVWHSCGKEMSISGSILSKKGTYMTHMNSGYGIQLVFSSGIHEWVIKILQMPFQLGIGIASCFDELDCWYKKQYHYKFYNAPGTSKITYKNSHNGKKIKYGEYCCEFDIITVHLDLNSLTVSFKKNNKDLGVAFTNIVQTKYRLAVSMNSAVKHPGAVEILSYSNK